MNKNKEGYPDPTAGRAIAKAAKDMAADRDAEFLIKLIKRVVRAEGFELAHRIAIRHKETGREYW